jgi:hypothetical protein
MALVQLSCPLCGGWFQVEEQHAGMQVACPHCQGAVLIPSDVGGTEPEPPGFGYAPPAFEPPPQEFSWRPPGPSPEPPPSGSWPSEPPAPNSPYGPPASGELPTGSLPTGSLPTGSLPTGGAAPSMPVEPEPPARQTPSQKSAVKTPRPAPRKANGPRPAVKKKEADKADPAPRPSAAAEKPRSAPQANGESKPEPSPAPRPSAGSSSVAEAPPRPKPAAKQTSRKQSAVADAKGQALLPPPAVAIADGTPPWPQTPAPLPEFDESLLPENPDQAYYDALFDPEKAALLRLKDPTTKVIHAGDETIELRRLTPEEKAARRRMYNLVMVGFAALVLAFVIGVSLSL